jgi:hypothetical protein
MLPPSTFSILLLITLEVDPGSALAIPQSDHELLTALRTVRENTIAACPSGRGMAELQESRDSTGLGGGLESIGPVTLDFAFSGKDNIYVMNDAKTGQLVASRLMKDDRITIYRANFGGFSRSASIVPSRALPRTGQEVRLHGWSFAEMGRIPWTEFPDADEKAFASFEAQPTAVVQQQDGQVKLSFTWEYKTPAGNPQVTYAEIKRAYNAVFNLKLGGMASSFSQSEDMLYTDGSRVSTTVQGDLEWRAEGGKIVPVRREVHARQAKDAKEQNRADCLIKFKRLKIEPVPADELSVDRLQISPGTRITDQVMGIDYRYKPGDPDGSGGQLLNDLPSVPFEDYPLIAQRSPMPRGTWLAIGAIGTVLGVLALFFVPRFRRAKT